MKTDGSWKPGQSGNPRGRPKKKRALAEILARAGGKTIEDCDGKRRSGKRIVARLLWQAVTTGVVQFPDTNETMTISLSDWLGIVKFLYGHIDGPPRMGIDMETSGAVHIHVTYDGTDGAPSPPAPEAS